ncbi:MAG TPA: NAD-binding protein [Bacteroidia bacterium]|nr:NAD-binding protein [Bacteroidia bacterium]HNT79972.1 NAD-binding protein [Bacteroidia bacterium]
MNYLSKRIFTAVLLLLFIISTGIIGYMYLEKATFLDAFYMTIITISSVGYGEVFKLDNAGKLFTAFLIIGSLGTATYAFSVITSYIADGEYVKRVRQMKYQKLMKNLSNHVIVCGYGRNGKQACAELQLAGIDYVVIDSEQHKLDPFIDQGHRNYVLGDATNEDILSFAGVTKARALITTLPNDANNVFVVLSAREVNKSIKIISRASNGNAEKKLIHAGANNVIMPDKVGGTHMASLVTNPDVLAFLDFISGHIHIQIQELPYEELPKHMKGKSIIECNIKAETGVNILGYKTKEGQYIVNPDPHTVLEPNSKLFVLGTNDQIKKLKTQV